jgi:hypothetical protein
MQRHKSRVKLLMLTGHHKSTCRFASTRATINLLIRCKTQWQEALIGKESQLIRIRKTMLSVINIRLGLLLQIQSQNLDGLLSNILNMLRLSIQLQE